jgi:predicted DNA-binding transcriptional regulator AlpA
VEGRSDGGARTSSSGWRKICLRITICRRGRAGGGSLGKRAYRWNPAAAWSSERACLARSTSVRNEAAMASASPTRGQVINAGDLAAPAIRILQLPEVYEVTGLKRGVIYRPQQKSFPQSVKFRITPFGWIDAEVRAICAAHRRRRRCGEHARDRARLASEPRRFSATARRCHSPREALLLVVNESRRGLLKRHVV